LQSKTAEYDCLPAENRLKNNKRMTILYLVRHGETIDNAAQLMVKYLRSPEGQIV
jgi:hypothetical protein